MKKKSALLAAAISGIMLGAAASSAQASPRGDSTGHEQLRPNVSLAKMADPPKEPEKNSCKGKNACKGKGGCKTDKHDCKGKNDCKGQGGCSGTKK